jgi:acyl-CoA thioesterase-1
MQLNLFCFLYHPFGRNLTKRRTLILGYICAFVCSINAIAAEPHGDPNPTVLLVMGDSISAGYGLQEEPGWVDLLNRTLIEKELPWQTINASVSGETTSGALARLPELLGTHNPKLVLIELGGNDGLRGYPTDMMKDNLLRMIDLTTATGARAVIMAMRIPPNYGPRYTRAFEAVYKEVAEQKSVPYIPFFLEALAIEPGMMQADGIHPTAQAQPLMLEFLWPYLTEILAHTSPSPPRDVN